MTSVLEYSQIRSILPHGHPALLVDRVVSLEIGVSIVGIKAITGCEPCYGNLPIGLDRDGYAYPTSLLNESFGQTAAILWLKSTKMVNRESGRILMFVAGRDLRIEGHGYPGDVLRHVARIDQILGDTVIVEGETWVGEKRITSVGSMIAAARPRSAVLKNFNLGRAGSNRAFG
jgi:3-hydroxyacyl-[acyl-carrier-protein] dehydratase